MPVVSQPHSSFPGQGQGRAVLVGAAPKSSSTPKQQQQPQQQQPQPPQQHHSQPPRPEQVQVPAVAAAAHGLEHQLATTQDLLASMKARAFARTQELRDKAKQRPAAAPPPLPTGTRERRLEAQPSSSITRRRKPQDVELPAEVAQHLAVLDSTAADIRGTFDALYGRDGVVVDSFEGRGFTVGTACSTTSSRVDVCEDRLDYVFHHAEQGKVHMLMRYRDFLACVLDMKGLQLAFKVRRQGLRHFEGGVYDPQGPFAKGRAGCLTVALSGREDAERVAHVLRRLGVQCFRVVN